MNDELNRLWKVDRPKLVEVFAWAASDGDRSENGDYIYGKARPSPTPTRPAPPC